SHAGHQAGEVGAERAARKAKLSIERVVATVRAVHVGPPVPDSPVRGPQPPTLGPPPLVSPALDDLGGRGSERVVSAAQEQGHEQPTESRDERDQPSLELEEGRLAVPSQREQLAEL